MATREELTQALGARYRIATRLEKARILDEFVAVTGYHRKHAIRRLRRTGADGRGQPALRARIYDEAVRESLTVLWEAADRICGKRLKAVLPDLVTAMERHGHLRLDAVVRAKLLSMSAASVDRVLAPIRAEAGAGKRRRRAVSNAVKRQVPVRTFADWGDPAPGYFESDFVVHNGGSSSGSCVHTLVLTDIASGWTECLPLVVREQSLVTQGLDHVQAQLPIAVLGLDFDNDGAFINETMLEYCRGRGIELTRSRPYRKNDQAWVEQKNGSIVRRLVGYERYAGFAATGVLVRLFEAARFYVNFFQPSFKLAKKERDGAKVRKQYHPPVTPCERLLRDPRVSDDTKRRLRHQRDALDPVRLLHDVRAAQAELVAMAKNPIEDSPASQVGTISQFLDHLPGLWRDGEVRPTHRKRERAQQQPRTWRTRVDPFQSVWSEVLGWLEAEPDATAKALFQRLTARYPGEFTAGQLRTLQRRIRDWRRAVARELVYANLKASPVPYVEAPVIQ